MNKVDFINNLIKERDCLKELYKSNSETIRLLKRDILKKDKKILKLEKTTSNTKDNTKIQKELDKIKSELETLKMYYNDLKNMYESVVKENYELKSTLNDLEQMCDSD